MKNTVLSFDYKNLIVTEKASIKEMMHMRDSGHVFLLTSDGEKIGVVMEPDCFGMGQYCTLKVRIQIKNAIAFNREFDAGYQTIKWVLHPDGTVKCFQLAYGKETKFDEAEKVVPKQGSLDVKEFLKLNASKKIPDVPEENSECQGAYNSYHKFD